MRTYKLPVVVTRQEHFGEYSFQAEGIDDYWNIESQKYDTLEKALGDIQGQLQKKYQQEADRIGLDDFEVPNEKEIDLDENQKIKYIKIKIQTEDEEDDW